MSTSCFLISFNIKIIKPAGMFFLWVLRNLFDFNSYFFVGYFRRCFCDRTESTGDFPMFSDDHSHIRLCYLKSQNSARFVFFLSHTDRVRVIHNSACHISQNLLEVDIVGGIVHNYLMIPLLVRMDFTVSVG